MRYLESLSTDAAFNLALEEYAFYELPKDQEYFMLWQNAPSVIIGRHQNILEEVNLPYVKEKGISVVRRLSGGGAVYHDLGNLNFTYIVNGDDSDTSMERFIRPLLLACKEFGIEAELSGRNDVLVKGRKFSGNAGYQEDSRRMHHGTILIHSDLACMEHVLRVSSDKFVSKGISSVRSRVANLSEHAKIEMTVERFAQTLKENVQKEMRCYRWSDKDLQAARKLQHSKYETWEWNYGNFPVYQTEKKRRIEGCGTVNIYMNVMAGRIEEIAFYGDFLGNGDLIRLKDVLSGCALKEDEIVQRLQKTPVGDMIHGMTAKVLAEILCEN